MFYKIVKGSLVKAPENIRTLIGSPTPTQYLFFGYKPLSGEIEEGATYVEETDAIKIIKSQE